MSSRKCKFKQHYDSITQPLEWSKSKTLTTPNADKEVQQPKLIHDWWRCKMLQPLWKTVWQCLTKLNILLPYDPAITLLGIYPKELKTCPHKNPHMDVYSSFICNCQNLEANRKFFSRWIDKHWNVIYLEIKTSELTWMKRYGLSSMHITKWKKSIWKHHVLYGYNYVTLWNGMTMETIKKISGL